MERDAMERDAMERGGYVLQHTPPAGIFFAGVGAMAGRLVFVISEPFTQQQRDSLEGFDFHLVLEIDDSSPLVTTRREADGTVELVAIDYAKLLACAYNLKLPGCGLGLGLGLRLGLGLGLRLGLGSPWRGARLRCTSVFICGQAGYGARGGWNRRRLLPSHYRQGHD